MQSYYKAHAIQLRCQRWDTVWMKQVFFLFFSAQSFLTYTWYDTQTHCGAIRSGSTAKMFHLQCVYSRYKINYTESHTPYTNTFINNMIFSCELTYLCLRWAMQKKKYVRKKYLWHNFLYRCGHHSNMKAVTYICQWKNISRHFSKKIFLTSSGKCFNDAKELINDKFDNPCLQIY